MTDPAQAPPARAAGGAQPAPRDAREMLDRGRSFLRAKDVEEARLDAELLVAHALGVDRLGLFLALDRPVSAEEIDRARELLVRRAKGEPVAYLTGVREFYGREFRVGPGCLVPRPETELVVDVAREWAAERDRKELRALDLGTGSGCLAVTLALELEGSAVTAVELSAKALAWARTNVEALGAPVELRSGDALAFLGGLEADALDLVVSNPPYVERGDALAREVRDHEPAEALYAPDADPDFWVRSLLEHVPRVLAPGGLLLVELGIGQGTRAAVLAAERGRTTSLRRDLAGIERVLVVRA